MTTETRAYVVRARSPLHVGAGQGVGFIDLPIMREVATGFPFIPGSAVKGVLADKLGADEDSRKDDQEYLKRLAFGIMDRSDSTSANAGSLVFTDARLICLPVRSLYGTLAWCTCPFVLRRLEGDFQRARLSLPQQSTAPQQSAAPPIPSIASAAQTSLAMHVPGSGSDLVSPPLASNQPAATQPNVFLEDLDFIASGCAEATKWAAAIAGMAFKAGSSMIREFTRRFAVVHDDVFGFLCEAATQVDARVAIDDESGTVKSGLWYEESLPEESILLGLVWCGPVWGGDKDLERAIQFSPGVSIERTLADQFCKSHQELQLGGKNSVGRGQVTLSFRCAAPAATTGTQP